MNQHFDQVTSGSVTLRYAEVFQFRRVNQVGLDIDPKTTILVGANNSGKTSILTALRQFLADSPSFGAHDISLTKWSTLRELGKRWEALAEDPATAPSTVEDWLQQLEELRAAMPTLDLWFHADEGMYHRVAPFLTSFSWAGGLVGIRLRLEPASSVEELLALAWRYREARAPVKEMGGESHAWPIDLLDYWLRTSSEMGRVQVYKLHPEKGPLAVGASAYVRQQLEPGAEPVERVHLSRLVRVDFVPAQRGLGGDDADTRSSGAPHKVGLFSNQLLKFARQHLNLASTGHGHRADLIEAVAKAQSDLDTKIHDALAPSVKDVKILGYPGLHDPQEISFRTRIQTADLLDHATAVQYRMSGESVDDFLPENSIGLGYQNLQSLSYQLVSFKAARLNPTKGSPAPVHLVMIEEPEAHLHVQVQRVFPDKAHKLISPTEAEPASLKSQLLISTHSSHLAHAESFARLRYVRRVPKSANLAMASTDVVNLGEAFGDDKETRLFAERYFRIQHTDLLFADAAVLVEGTAERMLVPVFIERNHPELASRYLSFLDIGGSHAHRLRPLIERLRIPTVVITDIDPVEMKQNGKGKMTAVAVANRGQAGLTCANATLTKWHPAKTAIEDYRGMPSAEQVWEGEGCKVRFAWQLPVADADGCWPSSFEDAFILSNMDWFRSFSQQTDEAGKKLKPPTGALGSVVRSIENASTSAELGDKLHDLMHGSKFSKGDFAATMFEYLAAGADVRCPVYIADALAWLQAELAPKAGEVR